MSFALSIVAAGISFVFNRKLFCKLGYTTVITYSPVIEEVCKTLPAYWLAQDILLVHLFFGVIEAGYEFLGGSGIARYAALLSIVGHFLFGLMTITALFLGGQWYLALASGILLHLLWNTIVLRFF